MSRVWTSRVTSGGLIALFMGMLAAAGWAAEHLGRWVVRSPMPSTRTEVASAELRGKIYVIGGFGNGGDLVEAYDPAADRSRGDRLRPGHHGAQCRLRRRLVPDESCQGR